MPKSISSSFFCRICTFLLLFTQGIHSPMGNLFRKPRRDGSRRCYTFLHSSTTMSITIFLAENLHSQTCFGILHSKTSLYFASPFSIRTLSFVEKKSQLFHLLYLIFHDAFDWQSNGTFCSIYIFFAIAEI